MSKPIPLEVWAREVRGDYPPSKKTLYRWIRDGKIFPTPKKIGRGYFVMSTARYIDCSDPNYIEDAAAAIHESTAQ